MAACPGRGKASHRSLEARGGKLVGENLKGKRKEGKGKGVVLEVGSFLFDDLLHLARIRRLSIDEMLSRGRHLVMLVGLQHAREV